MCCLIENTLEIILLTLFYIFLGILMDTDKMTEQSRETSALPKWKYSESFSYIVGLLWGSVAGIGFMSEHHSPEKHWARFFWRKPAEKVDKLREIRALSPFPQPPRGVQADVCYTDECIGASLALLHSINFSVNPCDNFFEFSCGRWIAENPIPPGKSFWAPYLLMEQEVNRITREFLTSPEDPSDFRPVKQAKQFYADCVNTDAIEAEGVAHLLAILALDGGWPAITQNWTSGGFDLFSVVAQARREFGDAILLMPYVLQDLKNSTKQLIYLDQPFMFFLPRLVLLNPELFKPRIDAYIDYFVGAAKELAKITQTPVVESELIAQAKDIIAFETRLAEIAAPDEIKHDANRTYNPYKLDAYQAEIDQIEVVNPHAKVNYKSLLELIALNSDVTIRPDEDLIVKEKDYLANLIKVLDTTDIKTIANYVHFRLVTNLSPNTIQVFRDMKFQFDKVNQGISEPKPREEECASHSLAVFGMAISVKYIEEAFDREAKENVDLMVENLRSVFKDLLTEIDWMDEETRANADKKVTNMRKFMVYPDWLFNQTRLEQEYDGLEIVPGFFLRTALGLNQWMVKQELNKIRHIRDVEAWLTYPAVVNAYFAPQANSIHFPAGILQAPFYRIRGPESINYGGIGGVIGHEITHGFDDRGSQFDDVGNADNWWSDEILLRFREKAKCFVEQYNAYETPVGNINGNLTAGENIADNGGHRQGFLAYRNWIANNNGGKEEPRLPGLQEFTPDQLYFLGWGNIWCENFTDEHLANLLMTDVHSPGRYRVIGALQNSQTFAEKFNCPAGSFMNPKNKCLLW